MLSKTSQYAINAVIELATSTNAGERIGLAGLAQRVNAPQHFLAKVLQQLVHAGIVSSVKGPGGGFFLSEENKQCTLADIVELFDGDGFFSGCILGMPECSASDPCPLHTQFAAYREGLSFHLRNSTIESMARYLQLSKIQVSKSE